MEKRQHKRLRTTYIVLCCILSLVLIARCDRLSPPLISEYSTIEKPHIPDENSVALPLVMADGNPHIRALMRMISKSESNDSRPYTLIYGGKHFDNPRRHPGVCVRIVNGPNVNNCSTAAGRYQMIDITWERLAKRYHPQRDCVLFVFQCDYSFEAQYQDEVTHAWLSDPEAWNMDIPALLKAGKLEKVRKRLSTTWTSLGYGIETNSMTAQLGGIYKQLLEEELSRPK